MLRDTSLAGSQEVFPSGKVEAVATMMRGVLETSGTAPKGKPAATPLR